MNHKFNIRILSLICLSFFLISCSGKLKEQYNGNWVMVKSSTDGENEGINHFISQGLIVELQMDTQNEKFCVLMEDEELNKGKLYKMDGYYRGAIPNGETGGTLWADIKIKSDGYLHYSTGYNIDYLFVKK